MNVFIPATRLKGAASIGLLLPMGVLLIAGALYGASSLSFRSSAVSNRLTDYAAAFVLLWAFAGGVGLAWRGFRWLLFACWPAPLGLTVTADHVAIHLGPFGRSQVPHDDLTATYRFELDELEHPTTEDFVDPEEEVATRLPLLRRRSGGEPLDEVLRRFSAVPEPRLVARLQPLVHKLRRRDGLAAG